MIEKFSEYKERNLGILTRKIEVKNVDYRQEADIAGSKLKLV
jgi:hypothetical protein